MPVILIGSIASGHAFQNGSHSNAGLLHQVMLFKWLPSFEIECISITSGCAFHNACHLNQEVSDLRITELFFVTHLLVQMAAILKSMT
jgi:hypothetical protein